MTHKKLTLPKKICEQCQLSFCWRRKWARDWDNVRYCSVRCKTAAKIKSPPNLCAVSSVEDEF